MARRLVKAFLITWFSFAFFYSTMMPFMVERSSRDLLGGGIIGGFFVASVITLLEWGRLRRRDQSPAT